MGFKIVWSEGAIADLYDLCAYIGVAIRRPPRVWGKEFSINVQILESFPFIGPAYHRGTRGPLREIVFRSYRIFHDVHEPSRTVEILHVRHGARDEPEF